MVFVLTTLVVIGTDCTRSYQSNYHTIRITTAPISVDCPLSFENLISREINIRKIHITPLEIIITVLLFVISFFYHNFILHVKFVFRTIFICERVLYH